MNYYWLPSFRFTFFNNCLEAIWKMINNINWEKGKEPKYYRVSFEWTLQYIFNIQNFKRFPFTFWLKKISFVVQKMSNIFYNPRADTLKCTRLLPLQIKSKFKNFFLSSSRGNLLQRHLVFFTFLFCDSFSFKLFMKDLRFQWFKMFPVVSLLIISH